VKSLTTLYSRSRSIIAFALIAWCAGTGCMIVGYSRAAATESGLAAKLVDHAMGGSMPMDAHACCKAKRSSPARRARTKSKSAETPELNLLTTPSAPTQTGVMNCCPLTSGAIVATSRSQSNDEAAILHQPNSARLLTIKSDPAPLAVPLRLPNRAHSYLLDCAFLI
jgi:hypothetical protein